MTTPSVSDERLRTLRDVPGCKTTAEERRAIYAECLTNRSRIAALNEQVDEGEQEFIELRDGVAELRAMLADEHCGKTAPLMLADHLLGRVAARTAAEAAREGT